MNFQIDSNLFATRGKALSNFNEKLPTVQGELANEILKGEYKLDFLPITGDVEEKKLEDALAHPLTQPSTESKPSVRKPSFTGCKSKSS